MVGVWRGRGEENMAGDGRRCGETGSSGQEIVKTHRFMSVLLRVRKES